MPLWIVIALVISAFYIGFMIMASVGGDFLIGFLRVLGAPIAKPKWWQDILDSLCHLGVIWAVCYFGHLLLQHIH